MKAKHYLQQIDWLNKKIANKKAEIQFYRELATSMSVSTEEERVQSSGSKQKMADTVCIYLTFEEELNEDIKELVRRKQKVIGTIEQLPANEYDVLHKIYVQGYELWEVPDLVGKSYSWVNSIHGRAIKNVQKLIDGDNDD